MRIATSPFRPAKGWRRIRSAGARDAVVFGLRWEWEVPLAELGVSAFVVPRPAVKGRKRSLVLVCNSVAQSIIESDRSDR
jgi:hypothetical protein